MNYLVKSTELLSAIVPYRNEQPLVLYENKEQQVFQYGFNRVVLITPIVEELIARGTIEPLACCLFSALGLSQAAIISALATSIGFGLLYHYAYSKKDGLKITVCHLCYSLIKNNFALPLAIAAHSLKNYADYKISKKNWEKLKNSVCADRNSSMQRQILLEEKLNRIEQNRTEQNEVIPLAIDLPKSNTLAEIENTPPSENNLDVENAETDSFHAPAASNNDQTSKEQAKTEKTASETNAGFDGCMPPDIQTPPLLLLMPISHF